MLSIRTLFPWLRSLFQTEEGLGEFKTVMQTLDYVPALHYFQEFSYSPECLDEAMQTQKKCPIDLIK